jgi:hypothetical protein
MVLGCHPLQNVYRIVPTRKTNSLKTKGTEMATQIKITWQAFGSRPEANRYISSATLELDGVWNQISNNVLLESVYSATNLKSELADFGYAPLLISLWQEIEKVLPANRTHTSLSVGDLVQINRSDISIQLQDGPTYVVENAGFELLEKVGA